MPSTTLRRPLPALVFLVALTLLTALVWWRVLSRGGADEVNTPTCTSTAPAKADVLPAPRSVTVTVLNATRRNGIGKTVRTVLIRDGFKVPDAAANDVTRRGKITQTAELRYGPGQKSAADLLAYYFPGAKLIPTTAAGDTVVVALGRAYSRVASQTEVQQALARDGITLGTSQSPAPKPSSARTC